MQIYTANHVITGVKSKANCHLFQSSNFTLSNILSHFKSNLCDSRETRLVIFISDFQLAFEVPVERVVEEMHEIMEFVESHGHVLTFAFLPFVPAYSRDPNVKPLANLLPWPQLFWLHH